MAIDPGQLVTAVSTGVVLGVAKAVDVLTKRKSTRTLSRQLDRLEAKVDALNEATLEINHRMGRVEDAVGFTPTDVRRLRAPGVRG